MSKTKREQDEMQRLQEEEEELRLAKALRFLGRPGPVKVPPPKDHGYFTGWEFNLYTKEVYPVCTGTMVHWRNATEPRPGWGSQNGVWLYRTKLEATVALRLAQERASARELADLDRRIEELESSENPGV
jgi:hypothetical protein